MAFSSGKTRGDSGLILQMGPWLILTVILVLIPGRALAQNPFSIKKDPVPALMQESRFTEEIDFLKWIADRSRLNGTAEFNFDYTDVADTGDEDSGWARDFYISTLELDYRVIFNHHVRTKIVVNLEDVGNDTSDEQFTLDEAVLNLKLPTTPIYFVGGKTTFPFGVFEDRLIGGTVTEDLYEIQTIGATVGFATDFYGLDLSASLYKGQQVIENLADFDTHEFSEERKKNRKFESFIANLSVEPIEGMLNLSIYYNNEPGDGRRNQSIGSSLTFNIWKFVLDAEYITALSREKDEEGEENLEGAGFLGLAFRPWEEFELAARYGFFADDRDGPQDEILNHRYVCGFNYDVFEYTTLSFEYRYSDYEKEAESQAAANQTELLLQLALEF